MTNVVPMKALLEAGVHFGHQTKRWNPRIKPYIFTERNGIHIIDLQQTAIKLTEAYGYIRDLVANGGDVLFVGTKKQAQETVDTEAKRCGMYYVNQRWLGGMLTNFRTIQQRVRLLQDLERRKDEGEFERLPKKEATKLTDDMARLNRLLGGIRTMEKLPSAMFVVDPVREHIAMAEARRLAIPTVALCDTNCNPEEVDYAIPANDDAIRAIKLLTSKIADAVGEGLSARQVAEEMAEESAPEDAAPGEVGEKVLDAIEVAAVAAEMVAAYGEGEDAVSTPEPEEAAPSEQDRE